MRFRSLLALLLLAPALALAQPRESTYVVRSGDTLYRIASAHGMTVEALMRLNGLEGDHIEVGQRLRVAGAPATPAPPVSGGPPVEPVRPPEPRPNASPARPVAIPASGEAPPAAVSEGPRQVHVVQAGETLFGIALRYDTTVEALRRLNGIEGDRINVGQRLTVAGGGAAAPGGPPPARAWRVDDTTVPADLYHFVEPGETLYSIAHALGLSVDDLVALNRLTTAPLEPGTMLRLPHAVDPSWAVEPRALPPADTAGLALVYPRVMAGRPLASGSPYDPAALTASHRTLPFGTVVLVTNPANGRSTFVTVADRGPVSQTYLLELSEAAADVLDLDPNAARRVELRAVR